MTILESLYQCNMCGKEMKHKTPKLVMGEWDGDSFSKLDVHICESCRPELMSFANGDYPTGKEFTREEIAKTKEGKKWVGNLHRASAIVSAPEKKHEFYGNQYLLRNRKSRSAAK